MKERPILFSAPMVRAILAGQKTQTRRIMNPQPVHVQHHEWKGETLYDAEHRLWWWKDQSFENLIDFESGCAELAKFCPYGAPGDRLWVRETHARFSVGEGMDRPVPECVAYRATCDDGRFDYVNTRGEVIGLKVTKWTPAIHMPRWASRITLDIAAVRVERLHAITEDDARAEGVKFGELQDFIINGERGKAAIFNARDAFAYLWANINGPESWKANPWVWVVTFKRLEQLGRSAA